MNWVKAALVFFLGGVLLVTAVGAYSFDGDCVVQENAYYRIEQCPHTLTEFSNYVNLSITNKHAQPHDLRLAFGFDSSVAQPKKAWRWGLAAHQVPSFGWVSESYTCNGDFNYSLNPNRFWCYDYNGTLKLSHSFVNGWVENKTAEWFEWRQNGFETQWWNDWIALNDYFTASEFQGKTWFSTPTNVSFTPGQTRTLRALVQVKPNTVGKYDVFAWLGGYSAEEAWGDSTKSVLLDPWWNATWAYRRAINVSDGWNLDRLTELVNVNITSTTSVVNCSNSRITAVNGTGDEVQTAFMVLDDGSASAVSANKYCYIQFSANLSAAGNATYSPRNQTNYYFYSRNTSDVPRGDSFDLKSWDAQYNAWVDPVSDGWPNVSSGSVQNYSYANPAWRSANAVWHVNDTVAGNWITWGKAVTLATTRTWELRARFISNATQWAALTSWVVDAGPIARRGLNVLGGWVQANHPSPVTVVANNYTTNTTPWKVYRFVTDSQGIVYSVFEDGVNKTWGSNLTQASNGAGSFYFGTDYIGGGVGKWELDYVAYKMNGYYPPLEVALCAEEGMGLHELKVFGYDAHTGAQLSGNFMVANSTNETSQGGWYYNKTMPNAPYKSLTIVANRTGYEDSSLYTYWNGAADVNYTLYLFNTTVDDVVFVRFTVSDSIGQKIEDALLSVYKDFGGTLTLLTQKKTDSFGIASFYMNSKTEYVVAATHANYNDVNKTVTPVLNDYSIVMGGGGGNGTGAGSYESCYSNTTFYRFPRLPSFFNGTTNVTLTIYSSDNSLEWYGWNVTWNGTPVNYTNTTFTNSGGTLWKTLTFDEANASGEVWIHSFWKRSGYGQCDNYREYNVYNTTGTTGFIGALIALKTEAGLDDFGLGLIAVFLTALMIAFTSRYTASGGAIIGIAMVFIFTFITGWFNVMFGVFLAVVGGAWAYYAYSRGM